MRRRRKLKLPKHRPTVTFDTPLYRASRSLQLRRRLFLLSAVTIIAALALVAYQVVVYASTPVRLPRGLSLGGVPSGGLTPEEAAAQLEARYATLVQLDYAGHALLLDPAAVGFRVNTDAMLTSLSENTRSDFFAGFRRFLWRMPDPEASEWVPLDASFSPEALRQYLDNVAARYDIPPRPPHPAPGTLLIQPGEPGRTLDVDASLPAIDAALMDPDRRTATLAVSEAPAPPASLETLKLLLQQYVLLRPFRGLLSVTVVDLQTGEELHANLLNGELIRTEPGIAVAATSAVKALIITEFFRERPDGLLPYEAVEIQYIVESSSNTSADNLMLWIGDSCWECAFNTINQTGREIGMENTFVGGIYYAEGVYEFQFAPPGIVTPANQLTDFTTNPDPYFQTTTTDLALLYTAIYKCSKDDGGLLDLYPEEFSPQHCQNLIDWLSKVVDPLIIKKGVPDGTKVAHKHGFTAWLEGTRGPDTVGDAGIVFTPGGDYVLSAFTYRADDPSWEEFTAVIGDVSRAVYNYFNPAD